MKFNDSLLDDLGRVAQGAASAFQGFRDQMDPRRASNAGDGVSREEFDSVRDMAAKAREIQEDLLQRIAALEARLASREPEKP